MPVSRSKVIAAYRELLGREPEDEAAISHKIEHCANSYELAVNLARSVEFRLISLGQMESLPTPDRLILIGSHHKTGTEWMGGMFSRIARATNLKYYNGIQDNLQGDESIFLQVDSLFNFEQLPPYRGLHIIRDPRDVIISGAFYHESTDEEEWMLTPRQEFDDLSYQEKLRSLQNVRDKFCFEMDNRGGITLDQLRRWDYRNASFFEVKYEDLITDVDLHMFAEIFKFLGFKGLSLPLCLEVAWYSSVFSGRVTRPGVHIRSGAPAQWRTLFTREIAGEFLRRFDDILTELGYEPDDSWVDRLAPDHET
jgi:hypothetical protein